MTTDFRDNIKVSQVSVMLGFVSNWIRKFLNHLHPDMSQQLFAVVENEAADVQVVMHVRGRDG